MSEWKEYKLIQVSDIFTGFAFKGNEYESSGNLKVVRGENVTLGFLRWDSEKHWNKSIKGLEKYLLREEDIVIGMDGSRVGQNRAIILKNELPLILAQRVALLRVKNGFDQKYLWYNIFSKQFRDYIESIQTGTSIPHISQSQIGDYKILTPKKNEQTAISQILSSLDDKIDLLHRQNKTLEQLAETLFRQCLDEETEINSEKKSFNEFIETSLGGEWGKENMVGEYNIQVQCIRGTDIADLETGIPERTPIRFIKQKKFESIEIKDGDLIMEISGGTDDQSTGRTAYINDNVKALFEYPLVFSNFCRLIRPKKKEYSFFLYSYIHFLYKQGDLFNLENGSSGIKNLNYKALLFELEYKLPNNDMVVKFHNDVEPYFHKINKNKYQIRTLAKLRDTLLPKLMSGEVRVEMSEL